MKDLDAAKHILGMRIIKDRIQGTLKLSQVEYIERVLQRSNKKNANPVGSPLANHFKLSKEQSPKTDVAKVPYASAIGSIMYLMICTRPNIAHAVGVVSKYSSN